MEEEAENKEEEVEKKVEEKTKGHMVLVLGGARSGKSSFAQKKALEIEKETGLAVTYCATAAVKDREMESRVEAHRSSRPSRWKTLEAQEKVGDSLRSLERGSIVILDCVTMMITNLIMDLKIDWDNYSANDLLKGENYVLSQVQDVLDAVKARSLYGIFVSNEVGLGLVPPYPLGRFFRDLSGLGNQKLASQSDEVYFMTAGIPLSVKD